VANSFTISAWMRLTHVKICTVQIKGIKSVKAAVKLEKETIYCNGAHIHWH